MRNLGDLRFGDSVHDMHDGQPDPVRLFGPGVSIRSHVCTEFTGGDRVIAAMAAEHARHHPERCKPAAYTNKMLVLVGTNDRTGRYLFAYSYDDRTLGFIEFEEG
jgi:hypothetical protein